VFQRGRGCVLAEAAAETLLSRLRPLIPGGETLPAEALLPAVAAAWAMGVAPDLITAGVQTFGPAATRTHAARPHALIDDRKGDD
jgi:cyanophycin synthetase